MLQPLPLPHHLRNWYSHAVGWREDSGRYNMNSATCPQKDHPATMEVLARGT